MNFDYLKEKKELVLIALLGVSLLLAVLILVKITGFFTASARAENLVKRAVEQNDTDAGDTDKYFAKHKLLAEALKKNNLFAPPPPKQHPIKEVPAIFGNEVLINNKWYKAGDMVEDAKIIAIEPTNVKIEWDGRVKVFAPISGSTIESSERRSDRPRTARTTRKEIRTGEASIVMVGSEGKGRGGTGWSENLSEKERAKLQRKAEQKQKSPTKKEKSNKLSKRDIEKEQAKRKKDIAQKTKRNSNSKPKKETTQRKIKK